MSWVQLGKIGEDYGPIILLVLLAIVGLWVLWRLFPAVSSVVSVINLLKRLPEWMNGVDDSNNRKEVTLVEIKEAMDLHGQALVNTSETLRKHVELSDAQVMRMEAHIAQTDASQEEWAAIKVGFFDMQAKVNLLLQTTNKIDATQDTVVHEVKHNGGSSIKDSTVRTEDRLGVIEKSLEVILSRLAERTA